MTHTPQEQTSCNTCGSTSWDACRLHRAAPDLLNALQQLMKCDGRWRDYINQSAIIGAQAAIDKATK